MQKVKTATFNGIRYVVEFIHVHGETYWPDRPVDNARHGLWVDDRLTGLARLDTIIHESLHACDKDMSEAKVERYATDIARLLWRLGYRDTSNEGGA